MSQAPNLSGLRTEGRRLAEWRAAAFFLGLGSFELVQGSFDWGQSPFPFAACAGHRAWQGKWDLTPGVPVWRVS